MKTVTELVTDFSPQQLATRLIEAEAGRDLLARLAEESGEKLHIQTQRIAELETENLIMRVHSTCKFHEIPPGDGTDDAITD